MSGSGSGSGGIVRETLDDVRIPVLQVDRVQVKRITIPAGAATGVHEHNGPVFGVIEKGTAVIRIDGGEERRVQSGEVFHEPADTRIDRFDAADGDLVFLAWFPIGGDREPTLTPLGA